LQLREHRLCREEQHQPVRQSIRGLGGQLIGHASGLLDSFYKFIFNNRLPHPYPPSLLFLSFLHPGLFPLRAFARFLRFSSRMMLLIAASAVGSAWLRRQVRVGEKGSSRLSTQRNSNRSWPGFFPFTETAAAFSFFLVSITHSAPSTVPRAWPPPASQSLPGWWRGHKIPHPGS